MILRKPYAFLIKYFKLIHIALFIMCGYLLFQLRAIYVFFQEYVRNDVYTYMENIASNYISTPMIIVTILILLSAVAIFYLMKEKEKPVLFYRFLILYSAIIIIGLVVYYNFYSSLEFELHDRAVISIYRDIIGIIYYIMFFFIGFTFVRGFGFDIKKFSFDKDLKVLNISETDNEEVEVALDIDKENIVNALRREKRLAVYYLKENAFLLSIILFVILSISGFFIYRHFFVENVVYKQGDTVIANNIEYLINNSYYINKDKNNNDLGAMYVVIDFSLFNRNEKNSEIDLSKTRLTIDNKHYYPLINRYESFSDIGIGYINQVIKPQILYDNYILAFKLDNKFNENDIYLEVYDNEIYRNDELRIKYQKILLDPSSFIESDNSTYELNSLVSLNDSFLQKGSLKVINYEINNNFIHNYKECNNDVCVDYKKIIQSSRNYPIIKFEFEFNEISLEKINDYFSLEYDNSGTINQTSLNFLYHDEKTAYYELNKDIKDNKLTSLIINIRGSIYKINLQ